VRRPARLERAGALTPRDRIWSAIRCFGPSDTFSAAEVMVAAAQHRDTVLTYFEGLAAGKVIEKLDTQRRPACRPHKLFLRFRLARDVGVDAPRVKGNGEPVEQGAGRDQLWRAMKVLKVFDWRELAAAASTEKHPIAEREASAYVRLLRLAGYLRVEQPARRGLGNAPERLRFVRARDTGPRAPLVTREKSVMDANSGAIVYEPRP